MDEPGKIQQLSEETINKIAAGEVDVTAGKLQFGWNSARGANADSPSNVLAGATKEGLRRVAYFSIEPSWGIGSVGVYPFAEAVRPGRDGDILMNIEGRIALFKMVVVEHPSRCSIFEIDAAHVVHPAG